MTDNPQPEALAREPMRCPDEMHVQFSVDGISIRKWARAPFDGAVTFTRTPSPDPEAAGMEQVELVEGILWEAFGEIDEDRFSDLATKIVEALRTTQNTGRDAVLEEAARALANFAWSCVRTDCEESGFYLQSLLDGLRAALSNPPVAAGADFQTGVDRWMDQCFGEPIKSNKLERADRFTEEALELAQTMPGFTKERAHALVDYVFDRPQGEINQEVGGVMVTLAALCNTTGVRIDEAAETELARIWTKVEQIRAKQAAKPTGSALPAAPPTTPAEGEE